MFSSPRRAAVRLGLLLGLSAPLSGADPLGGASPFLPVGASGEPAAASADATLELRGITGAGEGTLFSIYDSTKRMSAWKRLNQPGHEFVVRGHDVDRDTVTVDYQGRTLTLVLKTAKVASAPAGAVPAATALTPQPAGTPVVLNPTPADEQRRLEAIAAEVNRRRMIRQQALQASRATGQPAPQPQLPPVPQNPRR